MSEIFSNMPAELQLWPVLNPCPMDSPLPRPQRTSLVIPTPSTLNPMNSQLVLNLCLVDSSLPKPQMIILVTQTPSTPNPLCL